MAGPPWVKFSFGDLTTSLRWKRMTLTERGAYISLLSEQALFDQLPTGMDDLALVLASSGARISEEDAAVALDGPVMECFEERDGRLQNPRLAHEIDAIKSSKGSLSADRSAAGRKGGLAKASKAKQKTATASKAKLDIDRDIELNPQPPKGASFATHGGAEALLDMVVAAWPTSRLARDRPEKAPAWLADWKATRHSTAVGALALERYRASGAKTVPSASALTAHAKEALLEVERSMPPLRDVIDSPLPFQIPILESMGIKPGSRARDWPPGAAALWLSHSALHSIEVQWLNNPSNTRIQPPA